jgi:hypothetical protein
MSSNQSRYKEDTLSVSLHGSNGEAVPNWPVKWELATSEGHLKEEITYTDLSGVATNAYCGPGATDFVGASQSILVSTGY